MRGAIRHRLVLALALLLLGGCAPSGLQLLNVLNRLPPPDNDPSLDGTGWLTTRAGLSYADHVQIAGRPYIPNFDPLPVFGVGWTWRVGTFDFGGLVEHLPGATSESLDGRSIRLGSHVTISTAARWRFIDQRWGAIYVRFTPGLTVFGTTDSLRGAVALNEGVSPHDVAHAGVGFGYSADLGLLILLSDHVGLHIDGGLVGSHGALKIADRDQGYARYRGLVRVGLEWRL